MLNETVWDLVPELSDEFDVWDSNKWGISLWYDVSTDFAFNAQNVSVKDGFLRLSAKRESKNGKNYTAGIAMSTFKVGGNSYVEIRAKTIDYRANVTTALWLSDEPTTENSPNVEIDIMETLQAGEKPKIFTSTIHQWADPHVALGWKVKNLSFNLSDDFHVYGLERRNGFIRMYLDGEVFWEFDTTSYPSVSDQERYIIFSIEGHAGTPVDSYLPNEFLIDYVRTYECSENANSIQSGANLLTNPGFEEGGGGQPVGWSIYSNNEWAAWAYADWGYSGTHRLVHASPEPFSLAVAQTITGLETGIYRLEAMVAKKGNDLSSKIYVKGYGGDEQSVNLNGEEWHKIVLDNIYVDNGQCEIGLASNSDGGNDEWAWFDDIKFYKITNSINPSIPIQNINLLTNSGFEAEGGNRPVGWNVNQTLGSEWALWAYQDEGYNNTTGRLVFTDTNAFDLTVSQIIPNLDKGMYQLEAWARIRQGNFSMCRLYAKDYGGDQLIVQPNGATWHKIVINNINVNNGKCEIGMQVTTSGGNPKPIVDFDEVKFFRIK
ncbi:MULTISPECIES: glycoside hydrolase family 16 protein [Dysgonomonas]|nr:MULTISPECIES: glycoside hydrolase family 16 protein [Dysgonomonas]OJX59474.1 MAG: hypothetical protein BGO84_12030 [Dysgonomonas sp. 37-18]